MRRLPGIAACFFLVSSLAAFGQEWPSFRGPGARGVADGQDLPADWDVKTGRNVRWKTAVPGVGHSSPVVWGDRIFLTTAVPAEPGTLVLGDKGGISLAADKPPISWRLLCLDARDGKTIWEREAHAGAPRAARHVKSSQANPTQLSAYATALSQVGDQRSIDPLIRLLHDGAAGALPRAFAAVALGGICDWRRLPWNTPLGADINYRATVETLTDQNTGILDIL